MKRAVILLLILSLCLALCACGEIASVEQTVPSGGPEEVPAAAPAAAGEEAPAIPEEYRKYQELVDAMDAADYDAAIACVDALEPEPVLPPYEEVEITTENFLDYFEYVELPKNNFYTMSGSAGNITTVAYRTGYYLKEGFTILPEKAWDCHLDLGVKYESWWYQNGRKIETDPENGTYTTTGKPADRDISLRDKMVSGSYVNYRENTAPFYYVGVDETWLGIKGEHSTLIPEDKIEIVSASGTLYLSTGEPAGPENAAEAPAELPAVPAEYAAWEELIGLLASGRYGEARAYIEHLKPAPPVLEVELTAENFLDYFEYVEIPENNTSVQRYSSGEPAAMCAGSGFYLRDGFTVHPDHRYDSDITVDVRYTQYLVDSDSMDIDFENHSYKLLYPLDQCSHNSFKKEDILKAYYLEPKLYFTIRNRTSILNRYANYAAVVLGDIELVSASGTLYLYE